MILTIDGGTTNTRFYLMDGGEICESRKIPIGIRDTMQPDGKKRYFRTISDTIRDMTASSPAEAVVCSGMIGSENGLYPCPHITAPVSFRELAKAMVPASLPEIAPFPFRFVPGVKTFAASPGSAETIPLEILSKMDIMRGEETELAGICSKLGSLRDHAFLLSGSHMKTIWLDRDGRISAFHTSLTGELIRAAAEHTILRASVGQSYPETADPAQLRRGYAYAREYGISGALFKVRILDVSVGGMSGEALYAFLMGILLYDEADRLIREGQPVLVGGSDPFRGALRLLLTDGGVQAADIPKDISDRASAYGAWFLWNLDH